MASIGPRTSLPAGEAVTKATTWWSARAACRIMPAHTGHSPMTVFNRLASWMVNHRVDDLTSGFRVVRARAIPPLPVSAAERLFLSDHLTMSFFRCRFRRRLRAGQHAAAHRQKPHPPVSRRRALPADHHQDRHAVFAAEAVSADFAAFFAHGVRLITRYTYLTSHRFTNMSALLFITSVLVLPDRHRVRTDHDAHLQGQ